MPLALPVRWAVQRSIKFSSKDREPAGRRSAHPSRLAGNGRFCSASTKALARPVAPCALHQRKTLPAVGCVPTIGPESTPVSLDPSENEPRPHFHSPVHGPLRKSMMVLRHQDAGHSPNKRDSALTTILAKDHSKLSTRQRERYCVHIEYSQRVCTYSVMSLFIFY